MAETTSASTGEVADDRLRGVDWEAIERSPEFQELVTRRRAFVLPATIFFLAFYMAFILLAGYAEDFMASSVYEGLNVRLPLAARFDFLRRFAAERLGRLAGAGAGLEGRLRRHEEELRRIGLAPENLSLSRHSAWYVFRHFLLRAGLLLLLSPLAIAGAALHYPAYLLCALLARLFPRHGPDEIAPTVKILAAVLFMPLTWLVVAGLTLYWWGWRAAVVALPLAVVCGYAAMRSLEALADMRGWFKAVFLLVRRRRLFLRLLAERQALGEEVAPLGRPGAG